MSCGAACWRQLLIDRGSDVEEAVLRDEAGYDDVFGIALEHLLEAMRLRCPPCEFDGGTIEPAEADFVKPPFIVGLNRLCGNRLARVP